MAGLVPGLWIAAIVALALSRRSRRSLLAAATVAGARRHDARVGSDRARARGARRARRRAGSSAADAVRATLLRAVRATISARRAAAARAPALLERYVDVGPRRGGLSGGADGVAGGPIAARSAPAPFDVAARHGLRRRGVGRRGGARRASASVRRRSAGASGRARSCSPCRTPTAARRRSSVAPRTRLIADDPFARCSASAAGGEHRAAVQLHASRRAPDVPARATAPRWRREGNELHGDWLVPRGRRAARAHVEVELRSLDALVQRGALLVLLDLAIVGAALDARGDRPTAGCRAGLRARGAAWARSYRARLSVALFAFFVVPAAAFALWS